MSCAEVMYQPYSSSFSYPRGPEQLQTFGFGKSYVEPLSLDFSGTSYHRSDPSSGRNSLPVTARTDEEREPQPKDTQFLTANCILLTYFTGDISTVVDEHFSRALSQPSSFSAENQGSKPSPSATKDPSLLCQRDLPASFWNSNYQPPPVSHVGPHPDMAQFPSSPYLSSSFHSLSGLSQDPFYHSLTSQGQVYPHRSFHYDLPYSSMTSSGRFNHSYGSLLMQSSLRTGQYHGGGQPDSGKSLYSDYRHAGLAGFDGPVPDTAPTKDLYWF